MGDFDFDRWSELARRDPPAYFRAREREIQRFIDDHSEAQAARLREVQANIDCLRAVGGSPRQTTRQLVGLLEEHLLALQWALERLQALLPKR